MGLILLVLGVVLGVAGGIWLVITAFQESLGWGLACMLIPVVSLIFVFMHWEESKRPFLLCVAGNLIAIAGSAIGAPQ